MFVKDRAINTTTTISADAAGTLGNGYSSNPSISADGRYVVFTSSATNLVAGDTNGTDDIFVKDRITSTVTRVSTDSSGAQANNASFRGSISADGRYVAFDSDATNLASGDTNGWRDIFVKDLVTGVTTRVSTDANGVQGAFQSLTPFISADGTVIGFQSGAGNLVAGDTNNTDDVFVVTNPLQTINLTGGAGNDTYVIHNARDVIVEADGGGTDTILSSISLTLPDWVENIRLAGTAAINATGNTLDNVLTGNAGDNVLNGWDGIDTASYANAPGAVSINLSFVEQDTGSMGIDSLVDIENVTGSAHGDTLYGNDFANVLDGGAGADQMIGLGGNDSYVVDNAGDSVTEFAAGGTDTIQSSLTTTLGAQVENLLLTGNKNINATGNELDNQITGNAGNNILAGLAGNDSLNGGMGTDTAVYSGLRSAYTLTRTPAGYTVSGGTEGTDTLTGIEWLQFSDTTLKLNKGVANDFNGDGRSDVFWRNTANGQDYLWLSANISTQSNAGTLADQNWKVAGLGDFDADGRTDVLWRNTSNGMNYLWKNGSSASQQALSTLTDQNWKVVGVADFAGDGKADILWRHSVSGSNYLWKDGSSAAQQALGTLTDLNWKVVGTGDFAGDGKADILWRNTSTGANVIWKDGSSTSQQALGTLADLNWKVVGTGDFAGDGKTDILWRNTANGQNYLWKDGSNAAQQALGTLADQNWQVVGVGDYAGDGKADILWRNTSTGSDYLWKDASSTSQQNLGTLTNFDWSAVDGLESGDLTNGGAGSNTLFGSIQNDILKGQAGNDSLTGGLGADQFVFNTTPDFILNNDLVTDFTPGTDSVVLSAQIFTSLTPGSLPAGSFLANTGPVAVDADDYILYNTVSGVLYYDSDGSGATGPVVFATLANHPTVVAADLMVVALI